MRAERKCEIMPMCIWTDVHVLEQTWWKECDRWQKRFKQGKTATSRWIEQKATKQKSMCLGCRHSFATGNWHGYDDLTRTSHLIGWLVKVISQITSFSQMKLLNMTLHQHLVDITGWWFGTMEFYDFPIILGISSSQLTFTHIFQWGRLKPPTNNDINN